MTFDFSHPRSDDNDSNRGSRLWLRRLLPDPGDVVFLTVLWMLVFSNPRYIFGDGSTGWHLVSGQYILQHGAIAHQDLISYTFNGQPWVAYEWLSDLLMAGSVQLAGLNGLLVLVSGLIATLFLLLYKCCRTSGCHFALAVGLTLCGALASAVHWLARPHIFTFFGVLLFSWALEAFYKGQISGKQLSWILCLGLVAWANLHPGFLIGFALIGLYLCSELVLFVLSADSERKADAWRKARLLALLLPACTIAGLVNPAGFNLYRYIFDYLARHKLWAATAEYLPIVFNGGVAPNCLAFLLLCLLIGLSCSRQRLSLPRFLTVVCLGYLAFTAIRHVPVFVIVVVPAIGWLLARLHSLPEMLTGEVAVFAQRGLNWWRRLEETVNAVEMTGRIPWLPITALLILSGVALNHGAVRDWQVLQADFDYRYLPSSSLNCIKQNRLPPTQGFCLDNWGGYLRYVLNIPVFIDDRADFYPESFYRDYVKVLHVQPGWADILSSRQINWLIFPRNSRLSQKLEQSTRDWKLLCRDEVANVFVRVRPLLR